MDTKSLLESKTFQIAVAQAILGAILVFTAAYPELQVVGWVAMAKSVLDVFIRMRTEEPIEGIV